MVHVILFLEIRNFVVTSVVADCSLTGIMILIHLFVLFFKPNDNTMTVVFAKG